MTLKILLLLLIIFVLILIFLGILVAPERASKAMKAPFENRFFAHRGLHTMDNTIPENTVAAFERACVAGYGIELDVRITKDEEVVVIHDPNLMRPCGVDKNVSDLTYNEILEYGLFGTEFRVPLFQDALECIEGRVPLIVEIKPGENTLTLTQKTMELLAPYKGEYCVESFDPSVVRWIRHNCPVVLRGQLANLVSDFDENIPFLIKFFASRCLFNMATRPHFVAYKTGTKPLSVKLTKLLGAMHIVWTSHPEDMGGNPEKDKRENDSVIFEFYEPPVKY